MPLQLHAPFGYRKQKPSISSGSGVREFMNGSAVVAMVGGSLGS